MMNGWWAAGDVTVDEEGNSNLVVKARRKSSVTIAGASLTGVPIHLLHRDDGFNYQIYVNGRLVINETQNRNPEDQLEIMQEFGAKYFFHLFTRKYFKHIKSKPRKCGPH